MKLFLPIAHHNIPLSIESSWQEYQSGLPFPSPGDLPHPGIEPGSPALQVDSLPTSPGKPHIAEEDPQTTVRVSSGWEEPGVPGQDWLRPESLWSEVELWIGMMWNQIAFSGFCSLERS